MHWRPWTSWRESEPPEGWHTPFVLVLRLLHNLRARPWRCLECDHPWNSSLLRERSL